MLYTVELSFFCMPCLWHTEANRILRIKKNLSLSFFICAQNYLPEFRLKSLLRCLRLHIDTDCSQEEIVSNYSFNHLILLGGTKPVRKKERNVSKYTI